jgi:hypothetical protein
MIKRKITDKASTWKAKGIWKSATLMKSKSVLTVAPFALTCMNNTILTIKESRIDPLPITLMVPLDKDFLKSPFIKKPSNGNNGTR